jgi:squalene cyclase
MSPKQLSKLVLSFVKHPLHTAQALRATGIVSSASRTDQIRRAARWLLQCQLNAPDGDGYSRRYSLIKGWDKCYIETSGYIIPTLIDVSRVLEERSYFDSALRAGHWLLSVQRPDGSFTDIDLRIPQVFDTGQVLLGLNRLYRETSDAAFLRAVRRAAQWLVSSQDSDGAWRKFAYNGLPHAYYSRVAAALIEAGHICENDRFVVAGRENLDWVLAQERPNGYFDHSTFRQDEDALLHTLVYVIEGFSMANRHCDEAVFRDTMIRSATALLRNTNADGLLYSQYDANWHPTNLEYCVTGLAQFAGICFDVYEASKVPEFRDTGSNVLNHLAGWQIEGDAEIDGALPSSFPLWGYYGGMEFFNWNCKFFIDALIKESRCKGSIDQAQVT